MAFQSINSAAGRQSLSMPIYDYFAIQKPLFPINPMLPQPLTHSNCVGCWIRMLYCHYTTHNKSISWLCCIDNYPLQVASHSVPIAYGPPHPPPTSIVVSSSGMWTRTHIAVNGNSFIFSIPFQIQFAIEAAVNLPKRWWHMRCKIPTMLLTPTISPR